MEIFNNADLSENIVLLNSKRDYSYYKEHIVKYDNNTNMYNFTETYKNYEFEKDAYSYYQSKKAKEAEIVRQPNSQIHEFRNICDSMLIVNRTLIYEDIRTLYTTNQIHQNGKFVTSSLEHICKNYMKFKLIDIAMCNFVIDKDANINLSNTTSSFDNPQKNASPSKYGINITEAMESDNQDSIPGILLTDINGYRLDDNTYIMVSIEPDLVNVNKFIPAKTNNPVAQKNNKDRESNKINEEKWSKPIERNLKGFLLNISKL